MSKIKIILVDALFTIFVPIEGLDRYEMNRRIIELLTKRSVRITDLTRVYDAKRAFWEEKLPPKHAQKWSVINREILIGLFPDLCFEEADRIGTLMANLILSNAALYEVFPETRLFLEEAKRRGIKVVIGSNNDTDTLAALVNHFELDDLVHAMYASTEIGHEKPDPRFFESIVHIENALPRECVMIGNNPKNDVWGPEQAGLQAVLYDRLQEYGDFQGYRVSSLGDIFSLDIF